VWYGTYTNVEMIMFTPTSSFIPLLSAVVMFPYERERTCSNYCCDKKYEDIKRAISRSGWRFRLRISVIAASIRGNNFTQQCIAAVRCEIFVLGRFVDTSYPIDILLASWLLSRRMRNFRQRYCPRIETHKAAISRMTRRPCLIRRTFLTCFSWVSYQWWSTAVNSAR
jgi:hypothetical protein